jgi:response regulator of citrate/malate metabolism
MTVSLVDNLKNKDFSNQISVLLVGNNPIEMSFLYEKLSLLKSKISKIDTAFTQEDVLKKIFLMNPNCLLLDDNIGIKTLKAIIQNVNAINKGMISITLIKTNNKQEVTSGVQEYLMKKDLDSTKIYHALKNALRFKKTQQFLKIKYYSGKKNIKRIFI